MEKDDNYGANRSRMYVLPAQTDWDTFFPFVGYAYNSAVHESTQQTPFEVVYGFTPPDPFIAAAFHVSPHIGVENRLNRACELQILVRQRLTEAAAQQKAIQDRDRREVTYTVGDRVWLATKNLPMQGSPKLRPRWIGPFPILQVINDVAYKLELPVSWRLHNVFHVSLLKLYVTPSQFPQRRLLRPPPIIIDGVKEYLIDKILDERVFKGQKQVLVQWKGYDDLKDDSWEPYENFKDTEACETWENSQSLPLAPSPIIPPPPQRGHGRSRRKS